jgi:hypothetical protein
VDGTSLFILIAQAVAIIGRAIGATAIFRFRLLEKTPVVGNLKTFLPMWGYSSAG